MRIIMSTVLQKGEKKKRKTKKPTNLTAVYDEIITSMDKGRAVTVAYLAFSKGVNMFSQHLCIQSYNIKWVDC